MRATISKLCLLVACLLGWPALGAAQITFDKPENKEPLPTPFTINASRERILDTARAVLKHCRVPYEEKIERVLPVGDKLVTQPIVFTRGVNTRTNLAHYANPPASEVQAWTAGRVWLEIIALPLDEQRSQLQIVAHFQGRTGGIMESGREEWVNSPSNGRLEDEVLRGLAGKILGIDLSIDRNGRRRLLDCEF